MSQKSRMLIWLVSVFSLALPALLAVSPRSVDMRKAKSHNRTTLLKGRSMPKRYAAPVHMQWTRILASTFLLLFILATFVEAFHHHRDGLDHPDCPVCAAAHHTPATGISVFSFESQQPVTGNETLHVPLRYYPILVALLPPRAPPV
jgi:hypothetical protein